jgi:hypothetical protein
MFIIVSEARFELKLKKEGATVEAWQLRFQ